VVVLYRRFGTTYRSHIQGLIRDSFKMGPIGCPETSVQNYHSTLRRSRLYRGGSLYSPTSAYVTLHNTSNDSTGHE
jgi:hypothetical protein